MTKIESVRAAGKAAVRGLGVSNLRIAPAVGRYKYTAVFMYKSQQHRVNFGHSDYKDYWDYSDKKEAKEHQTRYLQRATKIRNGSGLTYNDVTSPNFWSTRTLWGYKD